MQYFDNAATSFPKAPGVAEAMSRFLQEEAANPGRSGHRMAVRVECMLDQLRLSLARLINASDPQRIVLTLNATDALNIAIKGSLAPWIAHYRSSADHTASNRPHVITTVLEHNSVSRPLQGLVDAGVIELTRVDCDPKGYIASADIAQAFTPATRLVVMTHASNVLGTIQPAQAVGQLCRDRGVLFCLDAAQTVGNLPIDVDALQADMLAMPGHKGLLGPTGIGALYLGNRCGLPGDPSSTIATLPFQPFREGGTGGDSSSPTQPTLMPHYLEAGTPNTVGAAGLLAAIASLTAEQLRKRHQHEMTLIRQLRTALDDHPRISLYGDPEEGNSLGVLSLNIEGYDPSDVATILDESFDIAVRAGLHCAPFAHQAIGTFPAGTVRVSVGSTSTPQAIAALAQALGEIAG